MQPKLIAVSVAAALAGISAPIIAGPLDRNDVAAMAYVSLPFGGVSRAQQAPILGFAVNHLRREQGDGFSYHPSLFQQSPVSAVRSLMDVRFNTQKQNWDRLRIGGADLLTYSTRLKADGTTETVAEVGEISTTAIVAGVAVGVVVIHEATKKEDDHPQAQASGGGGGY
ncbi:MAG: hypothetical protein HZB40_15880 [Rhodocyclales bacterium]|nr:hypothetical protein [Rhodocyclales bacterium]